MLRKLIAFSLCLVMTLSAAAQAAQPAAEKKESSLFPKINEYTTPFSDTGTHWALSYIKLCYETDLMRGQGGGRFAPDVSISNAEIATLAARIHAAIYGGTLEANTTPWYKGTMDYLSAQEIHPGAPNANATRQGFFELLSAVVPDTMLAPINSIQRLPDTDDPMVLRFYNAGILTGVDAFGTFSGDKPLTRGECAAMIARIIDPTLRRYFVPAGQVPAAPFSDDTLMLTVDGTPVNYDLFAQTLLPLMEETQALFLDYGLVFSWEENYGTDSWNWGDFFKSATLQSVAADILAAQKAAELGCTVDTLALTLFGSPTQAEKDAYALEHNIPVLSPNANDTLAELVLDEKLNEQLGQWVEAADIIPTEAYEKLDPKELWDIYE